MSYRFVALAMLAAPAMAQTAAPSTAPVATVTPLQRQSADRIALDKAQCQNSATQATGFIPGTAPPPPTAQAPTGNRARGAAVGALTGQVVGGSPGAGAAAGAVAGGSATRAQRRQDSAQQASSAQTFQQQQAAWQTSFRTCLTARGYSVK